MRVLILSSLFPPYAPGGSEIAAWQHACWLRNHGHDVGVWTTANTAAEEIDGETVDGITLWRSHMPRPYPLQEVGKRRAVERAVWHLQDHADPRNVTILSRVVEAFQPDIAVIHLLVGLGWNVFGELGRRDIPTVFALHDLVLACVRSAMLRNDHQCLRQCVDCRLSSAWKMRMIARVPRLGFYSPSRANLLRLEQHVTLGSRLRQICANPIVYPPTLKIDRPDVGPLRLLFVGRVHRSKGLHVLLAAAKRLCRTDAITLDIAGDGPAYQELMEQYGNCPWLTFHGYVAQEQVAALMGRSHVLCVPSIWNENAPGVVVQALGTGLPVLASDVGGIPELIGTNGAGLLVPPGDVGKWTEALAQLIDNRPLLLSMSSAATKQAGQFQPERAGALLYRLMVDVCIGRSASSNDSNKGR